mgnify:CR=1 FL=1
MLEIPASFMDKNVHAYQQICKRAKNTVEAIISKRYIISEKKWFRTVHYEVNVFGECKHKTGSTNRVLEWMLENDHISPQDYQLLKFYDMSNMVDIIIENLQERRGDSEVVPVNMDEMQLLYYIGTFTEDPTLTKEELLFGEQVRPT